MAGELSGGELKELYSKDFVVVDAEAPAKYAQDHALRKLTNRSYTPVWVFLDADGNKILENTGFRNVREARALHAYVSGRHYRKMGYPEFLKTYPKS